MQTENKFVLLMFGVLIVAIVAEQLPQVGGWLLLVIVLGALATHTQMVS
jgi:hypothetical protein